MTQPANRRLVTEAKLATDLGTKVNSSTYTTGLATKQDVSTLGATVAADATVRAALVPKWKPSTAYTAGDLVLSPAGQIVSANATFTSGATYSASNWTVTSGGASLAPTATKTTAYTAAVGDLAMMNVAGGATVLTLPTAPADKSQVGYRAIGATNAVPLTINRGGTTDTIGTAGATSAGIVMADETVVLQYDAANTRWLQIANARTQASLDAAYAPSAPIVSRQVQELASTPIDATPPTITVQTGGGTPAGATTTLTGTIFKYDDATNQARYNASRIEPRPWSGINIYGPRPPHTSDSFELTAGGLSGSMWSIDFDFYGDAFEVCVVDSTQIRVITDGKYAAAAPTLGGGSGNFFFVKVQYASTAYRRIRIETGLNAANSLPGGWIHGLKFKTGQAHYPPSMPNTKRMALVHDSFGLGGSSTSADLRGYSALLARILGFTDYVNLAYSGSGFTLGGTGNRAKFGYRIDDLVAAQPQYLFIPGSVNDFSNRATTLSTEAVAFYSACKTQLPNTKILASGPVSMVASNGDAIAAVLKTAAQTAGVDFLDTTGWTASLPAAFIDSDNYHPTVAGHEWIARRFAPYLRDAWKLPA